jgi:hypothetical protein
MRRGVTPPRVTRANYDAELPDKTNSSVAEAVKRGNGLCRAQRSDPSRKTDPKLGVERCDPEWVGDKVHPCPNEANGGWPPGQESG